MFDVRTGRATTDASFVASVYELDITGDDIFVAAPSGVAP
jgi:nitrite reductase/ring-hydroxylating ferredoxin subunit